MSVQQFNINMPGVSNETPRLGTMYTTDALATVATAGYLNPYLQSSNFSLLPTDWLFVSASDGHQIYKPVFSASGVCTLTVLP
jgi:hypothetical protein